MEITASHTADVSVDGQVVGTTPLVLALAPGTYSIRATRQGARPMTSVVLVRAGERRRIIFPMEDAPSYGLWVGVGVGAAVLTGVILGLAVAAR